MMGLIIILVVIFVIAAAVAETNKTKQTIAEKSEIIDKVIANKGIKKSSEITYVDIAYKNNYHVVIDDSNKKLFIYNGIDGKNIAINYEDILGMEIQEDGIKTNGVGRAVAGAVIAGEAGAVVGAVTGKKTVRNIRIVIYLTNVLNPQATITLTHSSDIKIDSITYKNIMIFTSQLQATVKAIINNVGESNIPDRSVEHNDKEIKYSILYEILFKNNKAGNWKFTGKCLNDFKNGDHIELYDTNFTLVLRSTIENITAANAMLVKGNGYSIDVADTADMDLSNVKYIVLEGNEINSRVIDDAIVQAYSVDTYNI